MADNKDDITNPIKPVTGKLGAKIEQMHSERREEIAEREGRDDENIGRKDNRNRNILIAIIAVLVLAIAGVGVWILTGGGDSATTRTDSDSIQSAYDSLQKNLMISEMQNPERDLSEYEISQRDLIVRDSVKMKLEEKYQQAKNKVEQLQRKLADARNKNSAEVKALTAQIKTLRDLLRQYLEEIAELNSKIDSLSTENTALKNQNQSLSEQVNQTRKENAELTEHKKLAEKLNVTGVTLTMLNKKDKVTKKLKDARKLVVTFTIPQNNSTPEGIKTFYLRITTPEGQLLDGGGSFNFEGSNVQASASKKIEYSGSEITGEQIYYDVRNVLNSGSYTVELFTDGYRVTSRQFTL